MLLNEATSPQSWRSRLLYGSSWQASTRFNTLESQSILSMGLHEFYPAKKQTDDKAHLSIDLQLSQKFYPQYPVHVQTMGSLENRPLFWRANLVGLTPAILCRHQCYWDSTTQLPGTTPWPVPCCFLAAPACPRPARRACAAALHRLRAGRARELSPTSHPPLPGQPTPASVVPHSQKQPGWLLGHMQIAEPNGSLNRRSLGFQGASH